MKNIFFIISIKQKNIHHRIEDNKRIYKYFSHSSIAYGFKIKQTNTRMSRSLIKEN